MIDARMKKRKMTMDATGRLGPVFSMKRLPVRPALLALVLLLAHLQLSALIESHRSTAGVDCSPVQSLSAFSASGQPRVDGSPEGSARSGEDAVPEIAAVAVPAAAAEASSTADSRNAEEPASGTSLQQQQQNQPGGTDKLKRKRQRRKDRRERRKAAAAVAAAAAAVEATMVRTEGDAGQAASAIDDHQEVGEKQEQEEGPAQTDADQGAAPLPEHEPSHLPKPQTDEPASPPIRFGHVMSLYPGKAYGNPFYPLDRSENITVSSMLRAKKLADPAVVHVSHYAAVYPDEDFAVRAETGFEAVHIHRSAVTEYPHLQPRRRLPILQEIIDSVSKPCRNGGAGGSGTGGSCEPDFDYLVYTNSDIGLHESFYNVVASILREQKLDAFSINRVGVPASRVALSNTTGSDEDLARIYDAMKGGDLHFGWDCFVIHKSLLPHMDMGNHFLAYPGWDVVLHALLEVVNTDMRIADVPAAGHRRVRYRNFGSFELTLTFHLDESEGTWLLMPEVPRDGDNRTLYVSEEAHNAQSACPYTLMKLFTFQTLPAPGGVYMDAHRYQGVVNCAVSMRNAMQNRTRREEMTSVL